MTKQPVRERTPFVKPNGRPDKHHHTCSCGGCNHAPDTRSAAEMRRQQRYLNGG